MNDDIASESENKNIYNRMAYIIVWKLVAYTWLILHTEENGSKGYSGWFKEIKEENKARIWLHRLQRQQNVCVLKAFIIAMLRKPIIYLLETNVSDEGFVDLWKLVCAIQCIFDETSL